MWLNMVRILAKLFWRIILPFILALVITIVTVMELNGRLHFGFFRAGGSPFRGAGFLYGSAVLFCILLGVVFWRTLRWGKEAEDFESHLKDADAVERERRRRARWIER
jgi:hypothetical protein